MINERFTHQDLIDANEGKAGLLCRCILFGIVEPPEEMNRMLQHSLAEIIIEELGGYSKHEFRSRFPRALKWAVRPEIADEFGIFTIEKVLATCSPVLRRQAEKMPEYQAYLAKHGPTLDLWKAM